MYVSWSNVLDSFRRAGLPARIVASQRRPGSFGRAREDGDRKRVGLVVAVAKNREHEFFSISPNDRARPAVLEASARLRHLLLLLTKGSVERRILFGHDERHLFWSIIPQAAEPVFRIDQAFEALKPKVVRDAEAGGDLRQQAQHGGPIRQGEWFFVPEPEFFPEHWMFMRSGFLRRPGRRGRAGHDHTADEMVQFVDDSGATRVYVRGAIRHPEHATIRLNVWHQVHLNLEEGKPLGFAGRGAVQYVD